ncbi:hypothetical protein JTB14_024497 [Gonioctena quinquepunctata]|nr:hypothetical protein JTB14_024497 [Gonioctena quinquepunctata]
MNDISDEFRFQLVNEETVIDYINDIGSKAFGNDGLNIIIIRLYCPLIVPIIVHIMNECLLKGYSPTDWKFAKVIPLPKISSPKDYSDLRQISILPVPSKVFERAIESQIRDFVSNNNILPIKQSVLERTIAVPRHLQMSLTIY